MAIPHTYDAAFDEMGRLSGIPGALLRAIDWNESGFKARAVPVNKDGKPISSAMGWGQILKSTLDDFNKDAAAHNLPQYTMADLTSLTDPRPNIHVSAWLLSKIAQEYAKTTKLKVDWSDPNFVGLVCLGYGAGWSHDQGVARVVDAMQRAGVPPEHITLDSVVDQAAKLSSHLSPNTQKIYNPAWKMQNVGTAAAPKWHWVQTGEPDTGYMSDPALLAHEKKIVADYLAGLQPGGMVVPTQISETPAAAVAAGSVIHIIEGVAVAVLGALAVAALGRYIKPRGSAVAA